MGPSPLPLAANGKWWGETRMAQAWPPRRRFLSTLFERMTPISLICVTQPQICLPKASCCRYGQFVPVRDSGSVMTRPLNGAPLGILPPFRGDPMDRSGLRRARLTAGSKDQRSANRARATRPLWPQVQVVREWSAPPRFKQQLRIARRATPPGAAFGSDRSPRPLS